MDELVKDLLKFAQGVMGVFQVVFSRGIPGILFFMTWIVYTYQSSKNKQGVTNIGQVAFEILDNLISGICFIGIWDGKILVSLFIYLAWSTMKIGVGGNKPTMRAFVEKIWLDVPAFAFLFLVLVSFSGVKVELTPVFEKLFEPLANAFR